MTIGNISHKLASAAPSDLDVDTLGNYIRARTELGHILWCHGATMPTDALAGYAVGCIFQHTDGAAGSLLYGNEGSATSCDFDVVTIA